MTFKIALEALKSLKLPKIGECFGRSNVIDPEEKAHLDSLQQLRGLSYEDILALKPNPPQIGVPMPRKKVKRSLKKALKKAAPRTPVTPKSLLSNLKAGAKLLNPFKNDDEDEFTYLCRRHTQRPTLSLFKWMKTLGKKKDTYIKPEKVSAASVIMTPPSTITTTSSLTTTISFVSDSDCLPTPTSTTSTTTMKTTERDDFTIAAISPTRPYFIRASSLPFSPTLVRLAGGDDDRHYTNSNEDKETLKSIYAQLPAAKAMAQATPPPHAKQHSPTKSSLRHRSLKRTHVTFAPGTKYPDFNEDLEIEIAIDEEMMRVKQQQQRQQEVVNNIIPFRRPSAVSLAAGSKKPKTKPRRAPTPTPTPTPTPLFRRPDISMYCWGSGGHTIELSLPTAEKLRMKIVDMAYVKAVIEALGDEEKAKNSLSAPLHIASRQKHDEERRRRRHLEELDYMNATLTGTGTGTAPSSTLFTYMWGSKHTIRLSEKSAKRLGLKHRVAAATTTNSTPTVPPTLLDGCTAPSLALAPTPKPSPDSGFGILPRPPTFIPASLYMFNLGVDVMRGVDNDDGMAGTNVNSIEPTRTQRIEELLAVLRQLSAQPPKLAC